MDWIQTSGSFRTYATLAKLVFLATVSLQAPAMFWIAATMAVMLSATAESVLYRLRSLTLELDWVARTDSAAVRRALEDLARYPAGSPLIGDEDWMHRHEEAALERVSKDWRREEARHRLQHAGQLIDIKDFGGVLVGDLVVVAIAFAIGQITL